MFFAHRLARGRGERGKGEGKPSPHEEGLTHQTRGRRMTGSAWMRWTLYSGAIALYKGGSLREGGPQVGSDRRLADLSWAFFSTFFRIFFERGFFIDFFSILEGFWRPTCAPKSIFGGVFGLLFWHPHFVAFFLCILMFFSKLNFLKIVILPRYTYF